MWVTSIRHGSVFGGKKEKKKKIRILTHWCKGDILISNTGWMHASVTGWNRKSLISLQICTLSCCNSTVPRCLPGHQFWEWFMGMQMRVSVWGDGGVLEQRVDTVWLWVSPELLTQAPSWQSLVQQDEEMAFTGLHADWWDQGETRPSWTSVRLTETWRQNGRDKHFPITNRARRGMGGGENWIVLGLSSMCPNLFV